MVAALIDGRRIAQAVRGEIAEEARQFERRHGVRAHLAAVLVGDDPASQVYVKSKQKACADVGLESSLHRLSAGTSASAVLELVDRLNEDASTHGILVQLPLPEARDERDILRAINPLKDVDAFHPFNVGLIAEGQPRFLPCTPAGVLELLVRSNIPISGREVVIVGRSHLVGRPLSIMLSQKGEHADATVSLCHSRTRNLAEHCRRADILVAAIGKPEFITGDMVRAGAAVIDVGINRAPGGKLVGDVDFASASQVAGAITPVPGGVGPLTVTMLLRNTLLAAKLQFGDTHDD